jgi:phage gp46-like protein
MTDVRLKEYSSLEGVTMDFLLLDSGRLDEREELATAVRVALGTDAKADDAEVLPDPDSTDRRGWWG